MDKTETQLIPELIGFQEGDRTEGDREDMLGNNSREMVLDSGSNGKVADK